MTAKDGKPCKKCGTNEWYATGCKNCVRTRSNSRYHRIKNDPEFKQRAKDYREKNKEKRNKYFKQYRKDNPEYHKQYNKLYYKKNKQRLIEYVKQYQLTRQDQVRKYKDTWRKKHPEISKIIDQRRRARKKEVPSTLTEKQWIKTLDIFNHKCVYCGDDWEEQDHFIPLIHKGGYTQTNIVPACKKCNRSKHTKLPAEFCGEDLANKIWDILQSL